jgi:phage recombination protein Bet
MSTEIAVRGPASDLAIADDQTFFTTKQIAALHQLGVQGANNADLAVFFHQATRTGLDPFARQIYMIERQGKQTIQTGIDGFRLVARRATDRAHGTFGYEDTLWCGTDGRWVDVWLADEPPAAAKVTVIRDGERYPAIALLREYVGLKRDGTPMAMWATKPALMLAKCAEALALRRAFPQDLSGLYTSDEMSSSDGPSGRDQTDAERPRSGVSRLRAAVAPADSEPEPVAQSVDVTDAEVVDEPTVEPMTSQQNRKIHALFRELHIDDEEVQRHGMSRTLGRDVASRGDLSKADAALVIDTLEARKRQTAPEPGVVEDEADWPEVAPVGGAS